MRKILLGLAGAAALAFSSAGNAQLVVIDGAANETTVNYDGTTNPAVVDLSFGFNDGELASPFTEKLTFDLVTDGLLTIRFSGTPDAIKFTNVTLSAVLDAGVFVPVMLAEIGGVDFFSYSAQAAAGVYKLNISGKGPAGNVLGFGGSVSTISNVPEPATWAMMLIGFGAVGATMRRRKTALRTVLA